MPKKPIEEILADAMKDSQDMTLEFPNALIHSAVTFIIGHHLREFSAYVQEDLDEADKLTVQQFKKRMYILHEIVHDVAKYELMEASIMEAVAKRIHHVHVRDVSDVDIKWPGQYL